MPSPWSRPPRIPRFGSRREGRSTTYRPTREDLVAVLDELDRTRARLAASWREAADRLRRIPHEPTALQGPYWYGQGWEDAIHELEDAADGMEP